MPISRKLLVILLGIGLAACSRHRDAERERTQHDQTAGEKAGKAAYWASKRAEKAIKNAGRELEKTAAEMHQGWKEAAREDRTKRDKQDKNTRQ